jgi:hypothetical protein
VADLPKRIPTSKRRMPPRSAVRPTLSAREGLVPVVGRVPAAADVALGTVLVDPDVACVPNAVREVGAVVVCEVDPVVVVVVGATSLIVMVTVSVAEVRTKVGRSVVGGPPFTEYVTVHPAGTVISSTPQVASTSG